MSLQTNSECNIYGHIHRVWPGIPGGTRCTHRHAHTEVWQSLSPFLFPLSLLSWTKSAFYLFFKIFYLEKSLIRNDPCNPPMFTAALPTTAKTRSTQTSTRHWQVNGYRRRGTRAHTHTHTHTHTGILLSHKKKKKKRNKAICSNIDGPRDHHTMWSKSERERQIPDDVTYMWNPKYDTNEPIYKTETPSQT